MKLNRLITPYIPFAGNSNESRLFPPFELQNERKTNNIKYFPNPDQKRPEVSFGNSPSFMGLKKANLEPQSPIDKYSLRKNQALSPVMYTPYYSGQKAPEEKTANCFHHSARKILNPQSLAKSFELLPSPSLSKISSPSVIALRYLEEQEKLNNLLPDSGEKGKKLRVSMEANQRLIFGMVSVLEKKKEYDKKKEIEELLNKVETLQKRSNARFLLHSHIQKIERGNMSVVNDRKPIEQKLPEKPTSKIVSDAEIEKIKSNYLQSEDSKNNLLHSMGINCKQSENITKRVRFHDFNIVKARYVTHKRLKAIRERNKTARAQKLRPFARLRGICRCVLTFIFLRSIAKKNFERLKRERQEFMRHDISIHIDITRAWILQSIRIIVVSIIQYNLPIDVINAAPDSVELSVNNLRLRVRIKAIFEEIRNSLKMKSSVEPIINFLNRLIISGKFLPDDYLNEYEKRRLVFDDRGRLFDVVEFQKKLLITTFLIHRVLIQQLLMRTEEFVSDKLPDITTHIFKEIASVIYLISKAYLDSMFDYKLDLRPEFVNELFPSTSVICVTTEEWLEKIVPIFSEIIDTIYHDMGEYEEEDDI